MSITNSLKFFLITLILCACSKSADSDPFIGVWKTKFADQVCIYENSSGVLGSPPTNFKWHHLSKNKIQIEFRSPLYPAIKEDAHAIITMIDDDSLILDMEAGIQMHLIKK